MINDIQRGFSEQILNCIGKSWRGYQGETVNLGIVDINIHMRLVPCVRGKRKRHGKSGDGKSGYNCTAGKSHKT